MDLLGSYVLHMYFLVLDKFLNGVEQLFIKAVLFFERIDIDADEIGVVSESVCQLQVDQ